jgi:hypothetical protein
MREGWIGGQLNGIGKEFWDWDFEEEIQRRGVDVNVPEIGSRVGQKCFGGISGFHAVLRRELFWGNLNLLFFWFMGVGPRGDTEEGGHYVFFVCVGGILRVVLVLVGIF